MAGVVQQIDKVVTGNDPDERRKKKEDDKRKRDEAQALDDKKKADEADIGEIGKVVKDGAATTAKNNTDASEKLDKAKTGADADTAKYKETLGKLGDSSSKLVEEVKQKTGKNEKTVEDAMGELKKLDLKGTDPEKLAADLAKEAKGVTDERLKLADEKLEHANAVADWAKGIATSYTDIAQRYKDAVTGLTDAEQQAFNSGAAADYGAQMAMGAKAAGVMSRASGGAQTGAQASLFAAASTQAAASGYADAMKRKDAIDQQRREMQFAIVQSASNAERANRALGADITSEWARLSGDALDSKSDALKEGFDTRAGLLTDANREQFRQNASIADFGLAKFQNTVAGADALQSYNMDTFNTGMQGVQVGVGLAAATYGADMDTYGREVDTITAQHGLAEDTNLANIGAGTYEADARLAARDGNYAAGVAMGTRADQRAAARDALAAQRNGMMMGVLGAGIGGFMGGAAGAGAGYQVGSGIGAASA